jgi:hypothetical protein
MWDSIPRIVSGLIFSLLFLLITPVDVIAQWISSNVPKIAYLSFAQVGNQVYAGGSGLYKSSDGGTSWQIDTSSIPKLYYVRTIASYGKYLYVGGETLLLGSGMPPVYRSSDGGKTFEPSALGIADSVVFCLYSSGRYLFAGTELTGVFRSSDSGLTWQSTSQGIPPTAHGMNVSYIQTLASIDVFPSKHYLFAGTSADGLFRTDIDSMLWIPVNAGLPSNDIYNLATSNRTLYANMAFGVFASTDFGQSWIPLNSGLPGNHNESLCCSSLDTSMLFLGGDGGGVYVLNDMSSSWQPYNTGLDLTYVVDALYCTSKIGDVAPQLLAGSALIWRRPLSEFGSVHVAGLTPQALTIQQNRPNPVSTETTFTLSNSRHQFVNAKIMDILGKECATIFSGTLDAGDHSFEWNASNVPDGVYFCVVRGESGVVEMPLVVRH